jgi:hypothetical protein
MRIGILSAELGREDVLENKRLVHSTKPKHLPKIKIATGPALIE